MQKNFEQLLDFVVSNTPLFVLTGAGCSTDSGIPDYRDNDGNWKFSKPVLLAEFMGSEFVRKRYWARSMAGWPRIDNAQPNPAHLSLAGMESTGIIHYLVTQNVDGLHQKAGSERVLDLHGNLDNVICTSCGHLISRAKIQEYFQNSNPGHNDEYQVTAPDGDVISNNVDYASFNIPDCEKCNGILKPDVVFFGETVPKQRVNLAISMLQESDALLIIGSSLMVFSGYRFVREAIKINLPVAAINLGRTRADPLLDLKYQSSCGPILKTISQLLVSQQKLVQFNLQSRNYNHIDYF